MSQFDKNKFRKQLVSGGIYIALAAAVVTVTLSGVSNLIGGKRGYVAPKLDVSVPNSDGVTEKERTIRLNDPFETGLSGKSGDMPVSDSPSGVAAEVKEENGEKKEIPETPDVSDRTPQKFLESVEESAFTETILPEEDQAVSGEPDDVEYPTEPETWYYGAHAKPADGYISRAFSPDDLIYSPTMRDYRTHDGIDVTGDVGSFVRAICGGVVEDVYTDDLLGCTVVIDHGDGVKSYYSNLSASIPQGIEPGAQVATGAVIGGIGNTAALECADVSHVHIKVTKEGVCIDPETFIRG